jgi:sulfur transfer complex TusBCD TusB component (DsrH family)
MALYILDRPYGENGIPYALMDEQAKIVLLHDALFIEPGKFGNREIYVFEQQVQERGLNAHLPESYKKISYEEFIDLVVANKVINFS